MRTTRRAAVTASGLAALGLAGCSDAGPGASSPPSQPSSAATAAASAADADPDRAALDRAFVITSALLADLAASDPVVDRGGRLRVVHQEHLAAISAAAPADASTGTPLPRPARRLTVKRLRQREVAAQRELAGLARGAASGAVARLLASMSAGIAAGLTRRGGAVR